MHDDFRGFTLQLEKVTRGLISCGVIILEDERKKVKIRGWTTDLLLYMPRLTARHRSVTDSSFLSQIRHESYLPGGSLAFAQRKGTKMANEAEEANG